MQEKFRNKIYISLVVVFGLIIGLMLACPQNLAEIYLKNYIVDSICLVVSILLLLNLYVQDKIDIFSPLSFFSLIYVLMFFVTPIYDIITEKTYWFGVDLFEYGIKGSAIALVGYIAFFIAYDLPYNPNSKRIVVEKDNMPILFILIMYGICLAANVYYLTKTSGNGLIYIFSLGLMGNGKNVETTETSLGFISMLSYSLPALTLLYQEYGRSKVLKTILFTVMFILQVERGFRFYIIQIVIMFAAYYFIRNDKKPKLSQLAALFLALMIPTILMTMFRTTVRAGEGMDLSILNMDSVTEAMDDAIWDNFRIYKTYYGIIKAVPNMTNYMCGQQMIVYTLIMFVPRIIWPGKPSPPGGEAIALGVTEYSVYAGTAYPNIGEYYYEFGIAGVIFFMILFARWMKKICVKYRVHRCSNIDLMIYCTLLGSVIQLVIRGYTPSNFWMIIFALLPYLGVQIVSDNGKARYRKG